MIFVLKNIILKSGKIQLFDINAAKMLENVCAHKDDNEVWSICLTPDKNGFVSGSADHTVKFWYFELINDEENETKYEFNVLFF